MQIIASSGYDREKTSVYPEYRKRQRPRASQEILRDLGTRTDHRGGGRRSVGNLNLFCCWSSLRIRHAVDRADHISTDGRDPTHVRTAGHGYGARTGSRGADLLSALGALGILLDSRHCKRLGCCSGVPIS